VTAAAKASQMALGATTKDRGLPMQQAQRLNLIGGAIASLGASQATGKPSRPAAGQSGASILTDACPQT
jgi:hypothetical protein